ncbi:HipA N-terminal domain-containing protein, partial [Sulfurimonas sp. SAG-AH-194-C20]
MNNNLVVKVDNIPVGELTQENNQYIFSYTTQKNEFISLTMAPRAQQYLNNKLHPLFEMHLPEGYLLSIIKKHFSKITKTDDFGLLKLMSGNINGRITYETQITSKSSALSLQELINPISSSLFEELVSRYALSSALSGVQPKVLA